MSEASPGLLDATRRARLAALGIELLTLRAPLQAAAAVVSARVDAAAASGPRLVLLGHGEAGSERLLQSLLVALGVGHDAPGAAPLPGVPLLVFGTADGADEAAICLPTLSELRRPDAKRAAWPLLRRLRRQLAEDRAG